MGWGGGQDQGEVALTGAPVRLCAAPHAGPASPPPSCRRCRDPWAFRVVLLGFRQTQAGEGSAHVPAGQAGGEGDREDQRERQTERDRERDKERGRQRHGETDREIQRDTERERDTERGRERDSETERNRERDKKRETDRDGVGGETERNRDTGGEGESARLWPVRGGRGRR